jgi:K+-transporting ATPase ATPase A chain
MAASAWLQAGVLFALVLAATPLLGGYLAKVHPAAGALGATAPGDRLFGPVEQLVYRLCGVDPVREQRWTVYALSVLAFGLCSVVALYGLQRIQGLLPGNPDGFGAVAPDLAFNTAVSFVTNTNWQAYSGEQTMSHLTQMAGLAVAQFTSAATGMAVAVALIRHLVRRQAATIGNFWVDLTRSVLRVLLPIAVVAALVLVSQGVIQNLSGFREVTTLAGGSQAIPGGPVASQEAIKELGTNGGGFANANSAHPFSNPSGFTNLLQMLLILVIPFSLTNTFGRLAGDQRQGWVLFGAMAVFWALTSVVSIGVESAGNPLLTAAGADQAVAAEQPGGNLDGKELRFGPAGSGLFAATTTNTAAGAVNSSHDSYTPIGGLMPLFGMLLGEVSPGGVGSGLYGMLVFALLSVFIAGLMVGRTPEYLGKKIESAEMKLVVVFILVVPVALLGFTAASVLLPSALASRRNLGPHGLSEILYAYSSGANNNGSCFCGLSANTLWYNTTIGMSMLIGRFLLMIPLLGIAGSLARKQVVPISSGTFPTTLTFTGVLVAVVFIVVALTYFPVLALGPVVEHFSP